MQYGTDAGEASIVEIFRVSPEDAPTLMEERAGSRDKLAGRTLMSFGAFLDERWRRNDMIWGRLDGAERLIAISLPQHSPAEIRNTLTFQAHYGILREEIIQGNGDAVCRLLSNARAHVHTSPERNLYMNKLVDNLLHDQTVLVFSRKRNWIIFACRKRWNDISTRKHRFGTFPAQQESQEICSPHGQAKSMRTVDGLSLPG